MYVAFRKKSKCLLDWIISKVTHSDLIHCEIAYTKNSTMFYGYTSYPFEGVRRQWNTIDDKWIFVDIGNKITVEQLEHFYLKTKNKKYDWLGCLGFVFGNNDNPNRYFCSEWCATVLGYENPSKISPIKLYEILKNEN